MGTTARMALRYPEGADPANVPVDMNELASDVDALAVMFSQGLFSARPVSTGGSPGKQGRLYYGTDTGLVYYDFGTGWVTVGPATVGAGSVGTTQLADNAVTLAKMADDSVGAAELIADSVGTSELAPLAVTAAEIANALKPSAGAGGTTEALRALGTAAGTAAAGAHQAQHAPGGADPLGWTTGVRSAVQPAAKVQRSTNQTVPNGTVTTINWDVEIYDNDNIHDNVTNNSRLTCKTAGLYLVVCRLTYRDATTGQRESNIYINGSNANVTEIDNRFGSTLDYSSNLNVFMQLMAVNDYVEVKAFQGSGSSDAIQSAYSHFEMVRLTA